MDFYSRQAAARRQSRWLILGFALSVAIVVVALSWVLVAIVGSSSDAVAVYGEGAAIHPLNFAQANPELALSAALFWLALIMGASVYKGLELRGGGGGVVARALGGTRVDRSVDDPQLRRLRNVVEEMAIASGVPVPEVYVLDDENGINAFAAGHSPANAAVAVTRGTLQRLTREELQGVIAHEFSHILNGDMQLNIRMMGWLFGLLVVAMIGRTALRFAPHSRKGGGAAVAIGLAMLALGYLGLTLGRLLQAAVSRQRERLADASAVQFTRNPGGLKGALLKIAALPVAGKLLSPRTDEVAHMLFVAGLHSPFATHPSLGERIQALDPQFQPARLTQQAMDHQRAWERSNAALAQSQVSTANARTRLEAAVMLIPAVATVVASQVGNPGTLHVAHARELRLALPEAFRGFGATPSRARALMLAVLLGREPALQARQRGLVSETLGESGVAELTEVLPLALGLTPMLRLPAAQALFPLLRRLPRAERAQLAGLVSRLASSDGSIDVFEFCLGRLVFNAIIDELEARVDHGSTSLGTAYRPLGVLFSVLAHHGSPTDPAAARRAFDAGLQHVLPARQPSFGVPDDWPRATWTALSQLATVHPHAKRLLVEAVVITIAHDEQLTVAEAELLRTVCAVLQCPLPPLLPTIAAAA